ncbi:MAG: DNA replication/repair protein RecF, partial [Candidatus Berkiellales bacterium]
MRLVRLHIHHVRNLNEIILSPHPRFNIFLGKNGSGKTSLLEAIYLLALGRSFRTRQTQSVITHSQSTLACFGEITEGEGERVTLGIEKNRQGEVKCKIQGEACLKVSEFAKNLPIQLMTPETFKLLVGGAEERRKLLDWGVFHVEHSFAALCQRYQRLLKQRNAALKQFSQWEALTAWDKELAAVGEQLAAHRQHYVAALLPFVASMQKRLLPELNIQIHYEQGWKEALSLEEALAAALSQDQRWGYTSVGPHRAEVAFTHEKYPLTQVLSRGQQKLFICALLLAEGQQLGVNLGKKCLYLIDDLASELDPYNRQRVLELLEEQGHQVFLTGVD